MLTGKHLIKFGVRMRDGREADYANSNFNGTFTFDSLTAYQITEQGIANGLTPEQIRAQGGEPSQFFVMTGVPSIAVNQVDVGVYVQDEWKWRPNFSISAGLRYEWQNEISHQNSVAPRIAFAWGLGGAIILRPKPCCAPAGASSTTASTRCTC